MRGRLIRALLRAFAALPLPLSHALGTALGWGLILFPNDLRRAARVNIPLCLPELSPAQQRRLLRTSLIETGKTFCEAGALWQWPPQRLLMLVKDVSGESQVNAALARGKGVIFATPHLGSWEMMGLYGSSRFPPLTTLFRPPRLAKLGTLMQQGREHLGARLVPVDASGIRALHQGLARGETAGILPDQDPGPGKGIFAPLLGIPANTMTLLSRLAIKTGATVIFCYAERLPRGRGYHIHFLPASEINREPLAHSVAVVNRMVEALIRRHPEQYQWGYKRFRTRPEGEAKLY